jgi:hypothetical protein
MATGSRSSSSGPRSRTPAHRARVTAITAAHPRRRPHRLRRWYRSAAPRSVPDSLGLWGSSRTPRLVPHRRSCRQGDHARTGSVRHTSSFIPGTPAVVGATTTARLLKPQGVKRPSVEDEERRVPKTGNEPRGKGETARELSDNRGRMVGHLGLETPRRSDVAGRRRPTR